MRKVVSTSHHNHRFARYSPLFSLIREPLTVMLMLSHLFRKHSFAARNSQVTKDVKTQKSPLLQVQAPSMPSRKYGGS